MAFESHIVTVRRLKKYIDDVIGKKANLPDTSKTIIGNISQINSDLSMNEGNITFDYNWGGSSYQLRSRNNIVSLWFRYQTGLNTSFTSQKIGSLPTGFIPSAVMYIPCVKFASNGLTATGHGLIVLSDNGDILYYGDAVGFQEFIIASTTFIK